MKAGRPVETELTQKFRAGEQVEVWPSPWGAKNWPHAAFNPETGLLYANTMHIGRLVKHLPVDYKAGQRYQGYENLPPKSREPGLPMGHIDAIDPLTGKQKWRGAHPALPHYSAPLPTPGGRLVPRARTGGVVAAATSTGTRACGCPSRPRGRSR